MVESLIKTLFSNHAYEEPVRGNPNLHFERIAFNLGQQAWIKAKLDLVCEGIPTKLKMPSFLTDAEAKFWDMAILAEMDDLIDAACNICV